MRPRNAQRLADNAKASRLVVETRICGKGVVRAEDRVGIDYGV
jgi:hypothetical protein